MPRQRLRTYCNCCSTCGCRGTIKLVENLLNHGGRFGIGSVGPLGRRDPDNCLLNRLCQAHFIADVLRELDLRHAASHSDPPPRICFKRRTSSTLANTTLRPSPRLLQCRTLVQKVGGLTRLTVGNDHDGPHKTASRMGIFECHDELAPVPSRKHEQCGTRVRSIWCRSKSRPQPMTAAPDTTVTATMASTAATSRRWSTALVNNFSSETTAKRNNINDRPTECGASAIGTIIGPHEPVQ